MLDKSTLNTFISTAAAATALGKAFGNHSGIDRIAAGLAQMRELAGSGDWNTDDTFMPGGGYANKRPQPAKRAFDDPTNVVRCPVLPDPKGWTQSKFIALDDQPDQTWCLNEDEKSWVPLLTMNDPGSDMIARVPSLNTPLPEYAVLPTANVDAPAIVMKGCVWRWARGQWRMMHQRGLDALLTPTSKYPRAEASIDPNWGSW